MSPLNHVSKSLSLYWLGGVPRMTRNVGVFPRATAFFSPATIAALNGPSGGGHRPEKSTLFCAPAIICVIRSVIGFADGGRGPLPQVVLPQQFGVCSSHGSGRVLFCEMPQILPSVLGLRVR